MYKALSCFQSIHLTEEPLKSKLYDACYPLEDPLQHACVAYKYGGSACHSFDNFISAIRYPCLCCEHAAFCRLPGVCNMAVIVPWATPYTSVSHPSGSMLAFIPCYPIHVLIGKVYCALMGICHLYLCPDGFRTGNKGMLRPAVPMSQRWSPWCRSGQSMRASHRWCALPSRCGVLSCRLP